MNIFTLEFERHMDNEMKPGPYGPGMEPYAREFVRAICATDLYSFSSLLTQFRFERSDFATAISEFVVDYLCHIIVEFAYEKEVHDINDLCINIFRGSYEKQVAILHELARIPIHRRGFYSGGKEVGEALEELLKTPGIDVNVPDREGWTPLIYSREINNLWFLERLLQHPESDINRVDRNGWPLLIHAADHGDWRTIQLILKFSKHVVNFNAECEEGINALEHAVRRNHFSIVKSLGPYYSKEKLERAFRFSKRFDRSASGGSFFFLKHIIRQNTENHFQSVEPPAGNILKQRKRKKN